MSSSEKPPAYDDSTSKPSSNGKDSRPLPDGWVKQWDDKYVLAFRCCLSLTLDSYKRYFYVDTRADPPRSTWYHPDDEPEDAKRDTQKKYAPPKDQPPPLNYPQQPPHQQQPPPPMQQQPPPMQYGPPPPMQYGPPPSMYQQPPPMMAPPMGGGMGGFGGGPFGGGLGGLGGGRFGGLGGGRLGGLGGGLGPGLLGGGAGALGGFALAEGMGKYAGKEHEMLTRRPHADGRLSGWHDARPDDGRWRRRRHGWRHGRRHGRRRHVKRRFVLLPMTILPPHNLAAKLPCKAI